MKRINGMTFSDEGLGIVPVAAVPAATNLIKNVGEKISNMYHQDNIFIRYRDGVFELIKKNFSETLYTPIQKKYKLGHADIPNRKLGSDYAPEFKRLHDYLTELLNTVRSGWGNAFMEKNKEIAQQYVSSDPSRSYKLAPVEALKWALVNPNAQPVASITTTPALTIPNASGGGNIVTPTDDRKENKDAEAMSPTTRMLLMAGGIGILGLTAIVLSKEKKSGNLSGTHGQKHKAKHRMKK